MAGEIEVRFCDQREMIHDAHYWTPQGEFKVYCPGVRANPRVLPAGYVEFPDPAARAAEKASYERRRDLSEWWETVAHDEVRAVVPKAIEYGATDLVDIGRDLARTAGRTVTDPEAAELGVYFYLRGKVGRWTAAVTEGRPVSDDTLHDIGVYVRMAQRIRAVGGWPFGPDGPSTDGEGEP